MDDWGKLLEADLSWREGELASLKLLVSDSVRGTPRHATLLRAMWTLLYAHYEGFFKFAWDFYLDTLEKMGVARRDSANELARFSLAKRFRELRGDLSNGALWDCFTKHFEGWMKEDLRFEIRLETESNLWPNLAQKNSAEIGLPSAEVDAHELELRALVSRRNDIAHGKKMVIDSLDEYQKYEDAAVMAMHELAVAVLESLEQKRYLRGAIGPAGSSLSPV